MCAHSSGAIGFPLRLLAREVYDKIVAIKGAEQVALITGEERIAPSTARYFCCTAEAMTRGTGAPHSDVAFVALDEAQLGANYERGHIFTDHMLHTRGREETMFLGSASLAPLIRGLVPDVQITERPRFSNLTFAGSCKLSRLPPRSAVVAFSAEQVYVIAEMLRRFRGGAAVVMGALSPETRNAQVAMFQSGEVDYIVATDAIGMGLNLDINHVAFAALTKFDGQRQRRLTISEMAQIAGRAGRHHKDGSFGTLTATLGDEDVAMDNGEIAALENHHFPPLTHVFWRESDVRFDSVEALITDLERAPTAAGLKAAPEAIDLAVLKRLASAPFAADIKGGAQLRRFWELCALPDFRHLGVDNHARFIARLWQDLHMGVLPVNYVAARIAELDNVQGDIHALQGRIAAIRNWSYICQRSDWVMSHAEMAARSRAVEARLSDGLHARLMERFVNKRTAVLMKSLGADPALMSVHSDADGSVFVEGHNIGKVTGLHFAVDPSTNYKDGKLLLSAGEKALVRILEERVEALIASNFADVVLERGQLIWQGRVLFTIERGKNILEPNLVPERDCRNLPPAVYQRLHDALHHHVAARFAPLKPLAALEKGALDPEAGSWARALLLNLVAGHGYISREKAGVEHLPKEMRPFLHKIGVNFGALDIFVPLLLKPAARQLLFDLGLDRRALNPAMPAVLSGEKMLRAGYRPAGDDLIRVDVAEKLVRAAHDARVKSGQHRFPISLDLAVSTGLTGDSFVRLLGAAGFRVFIPKALPDGAFGPMAPLLFDWRPKHIQERQRVKRAAGPKGRTKTAAIQGGKKEPKAYASHGPGEKGVNKRNISKGAQSKRQTTDNKGQKPNPYGAFAGLADMFK